MATLDKLPASLSDEIANAASGTVIWEAPVTDPKQVTTNLLHAHPDARFDKATGTLQLPPTQASALDAATTLGQLGQLVGQQTGVSKVTLTKAANGSFTLVGSINPSKDVASGKADDALKKAQDHFQRGAFMRDELHIAIGCSKDKAKQYLASWVRAGTLHKFDSSDGNESAARYSFDPNPDLTASQAPAAAKPLPQWKARGSNKHPDHDEVNAAVAETGTDAGSVGYAIDVLVRDLRFRRWDMQSQPGGGDANHRKAYEIRRKALERLVGVAHVFGHPYNPAADTEIGNGPEVPTPSF
jgi:hypothetical protein